MILLGKQIEIWIFVEPFAEYLFQQRMRWNGKESEFFFVVFDWIVSENTRSLELTLQNGYWDWYIQYKRWILNVFNQWNAFVYTRVSCVILIRMMWQNCQSLFFGLLLCIWKQSDCYSGNTLDEAWNGMERLFSQSISGLR